MITQVEYTQCKYPSTPAMCVEIEFTAHGDILKLKLSVSDALTLSRDLWNRLHGPDGTGTTDDIDPHTGAAVPR